MHLSRLVLIGTMAVWLWDMRGGLPRRTGGMGGVYLGPESRTSSSYRTGSCPIASSRTR